MIIEKALEIGTSYCVHLYKHASLMKLLPPNSKFVFQNFYINSRSLANQ